MRQPRGRALLLRALPGTSNADLVRAYVWEAPVRASHWLIFLSFVMLASTGAYIHRPYIVIGLQDPFFMASVRFVHEVAAFVFTLAWILRIYWMFMGNQCSNWRAFVPLRRGQWHGIGEMFKYYTFLRWTPVHRIGHNSLAASAYMVMFTLMLVEIITGFTMFARILGLQPFVAMFGWISNLIDIQYLRGVHYFIMFVFFAFIIHHVYSAVLVSAEERNGLIESIFTGYKFIPEAELSADEAACVLRANEEERAVRPPVEPSLTDEAHT